MLGSIWVPASYLIKEIVWSLLGHLPSVKTVEQRENRLEQKNKGSSKKKPRGEKELRGNVEIIFEVLLTMHISSRVLNLYTRIKS